MHPTHPPLDPPLSLAAHIRYFSKAIQLFHILFCTVERKQKFTNGTIEDLLVSLSQPIQLRNSFVAVLLVVRKRYFVN